MKISTITLGVATTNCYIVELGNERIIIDPVIQNAQIDDVIGSHHVSAILLTHGHFDHTFGADYYHEKYQAPVYIHQNDVVCLQDNDANLSHLFGISGKKMELNPVVLQSKQGTIQIGKQTIEYILFPGHSRGQVAYVFEKQQVIFVGDLVFAGSIGRYDLPRCDAKAMKKSIQQFFGNTDWNTKNMKLYPGHGPSTTFLQELQTNDMVKSLL